MGFDKASDRTPAWQSASREHLWMPYCQMQTAPLPTPVARTEGVFLILSDRRRLIDGLASWWSACHGYNHPHIVESMTRQLHCMPHVMMGGIQHQPAATLATRLAAILPGDLNHVFFSDSGSVAVEVAMKMAIQFHRNLGDRQRTRFVSFAHAYHGDTTGAMSLCDPQRSMHAHFGDALLQQHSLPIPDSPERLEQFDEFLTRHGEQIAAVFIEPLVQGAGGMRFHSADVLTEIDRSCRKHGVLWVADELATGFGRTGTMFAVEQAGVVPDIICLGKALSGGAIGLAATVARDGVYQAFLSDDPSKALMHGPTFMGNPLACAAANASLDLFETEPRLEQVSQIESQLVTALEPCRNLSNVVDVRCKGAIGVVQVDRLHQLDQLRQHFVDAGVWVRPFGDCIYLTPSLTITADELTQLTEAFVTVTTQWSSNAS
ncbi:adenosylmethionine--8-amino-7-oxononanoate transaminase [Stieleria varia]|uniref:Adenosylmethionine-8-amino-7-oxononanoate aminotransferase n=1 Tax=Stieleria varia TaxID=2528005 RepID=A0A5C6B2S7_9BACT|nr:adenosylmethionine--8-amino-7-oxononanoate transaminase [Stieleria varia]TWU06127.1 Adenosylmethionine-8-amino-7-oxononanoate aminotransferase [Stieleria varia]